MTRRTLDSLRMLRHVASLGLLLAARAGAAPLDPPPEAVVTEAAAIVARMSASPRGPYSRIRWFCNDGTEQDPEPFACRDHGGGHQYAGYSRDRRRLAELGWHVGTVVTALTLDEIWQPATRHARLRELPLERYLIDTRNGWVLGQARNYRGRVQAEDEEWFGRRILLALLADPVWVDGNYLLLRELAAVLPHGGEADLTRTVRRAAADLADRDTTFDQLRIEIHTAPEPGTVARVRDWTATYLARADADTEVAALATSIGDGLEALLGTEGRSQRLAGHARVLARFPAFGFAAEQLVPQPGAGALERLQRAALALSALRTAMAEDVPARARLAALDASREVEAEARRAAEAFIDEPGLSRRTLVVAADHLAAAAFGAGLLSDGERRALARAVASQPGRSFTVSAYLDALAQFSLSTSWALGHVRHTFAEALVRYSALEPAAAGFPDDLLRGSIMAPLGTLLARLGADAQALSGVPRNLFGQTAHGLVGLNPGVARGRLRVLDARTRADGTNVGREDIVLISETVADLPPVAGVITLGEGNPVSHVQLLARNFAIPNVRVGPDEAAALAAYADTDVALVVGSDGAVFLGPGNALERVDESASAAAERLTAPTPDLDVRTPLPLDALHKGLSGRVVGPKAANLGELNRLFPGRVAPAVALPFGVFADHVGTGAGSPLRALARAYDDAHRKRIDAAGLERELARIRANIITTRLSAELRAELLPIMSDLFGAPGTYGVFVRSDTNVEDLPGFTGAGLNETLPNVVGLEAQLAGVSRVWGSPLSPRAVAWRSSLLTNPEAVYASVLLMKSVPATKSGVLVTTDLAGRTSGMTVSTSWGVGGAVAGEAAETLVLSDDGGERLASEAKAPYRRRLAAAGGIEWVPARAGPVLTAAEKQALRDLAREVHERYPASIGPDGRAQPWDVEFGFVDGALTLFQIRPLVERGAQRADRFVAALLRSSRTAPAEYALDEPPGAAP